MSSYIISLIVFPYVARTLGVASIGRIDFSNNIIAYFSLFGLMGVSSVGIREIASTGNNREERSKVFSSILSFIILLTSISLVILFISIYNIKKLEDYKDLLTIGAFSLFFTTLLVEWLYQGTEQFKYISKRSIILRIIYALSVFCFVKAQDDYLVYYILTVISTILNAIINIAYSRHFVDFKVRYIRIFKYAKDIISLGTYKILTSMYTTFNVVFLGFVCNDIQVGFYSTSTKFFYILLGVLSAFTSVMLPRMTALLSEKKEEEFKLKISYSFELVFMFAIPTIIGTIIFAPHIILLLSGTGFEGAIAPMRIITPMLFITGIAQICVIQVLMPLRMDKIILCGSIVGAVIGIAANLIFVREYGAIGTAITLLLSEISGDLCSFIYIIKNRIIKFPWHNLVRHMIYSVPYIVLCFLIKSIDCAYIMQLVLAFLFCSLYFIIQNLFIIKNPIIVSAFKTLKHYIK